MKPVESLRSLVVRLLFRVWYRRHATHYDIVNTLVVASSPRGGSTWLAEIIATLPGYVLLNEPLQHGCPREYGFQGWKYVPPNANEPLKREYLKQVMSGRTLVRHFSWAHFSDNVRKLLLFHGFLVKFTQAGPLLYWMLQEFPVRTVFMIRHPCAVVASQLRHPLWHITKASLALSSELARDFPHLVKVYQTIETREEAFAFRWAVENYIPLSQPRPHPWCLVTYESLVKNGRQEIDRIFQFLGHHPPEKAYKTLCRPSATTYEDSNIMKKKNPLTGWRDRLTWSQIRSILDICHRVGIDFYSDDLIPDYKKLDKYV